MPPVAHIVNVRSRELVAVVGGIHIQRLFNVLEITVVWSFLALNVDDDVLEYTQFVMRSLHSYN